MPSVPLVLSSPTCIASVITMAVAVTNPHVYVTVGGWPDRADTDEANGSISTRMRMQIAIKGRVGRHEDGQR